MDRVIHATKWIKRSRKKKEETKEQLERDAQRNLPPISIKMTQLLIKLIQYLNDNALSEEGLYRREGSISERKHLTDIILNKQFIPEDLSAYDPHAITATIKYILRTSYEPLLSYAEYDYLIDALSSRRQLMDAITVVFTKIPASNRELLEKLLKHLNSISTTPATRMSADSLSRTIGISFVRKSEKDEDNTIHSIDDRRGIAMVLIEDATLWPYDCSTEMNLRVLPDSNREHAGNSNDVELAAIKVSWKNKHVQFSEEDLEEIFDRYGSVKMVGINKKRNRAIIIFSNLEEAMEALSFQREYVRVQLKTQAAASPSKDSVDVADSNASLSIDESLNIPQEGESNTVLLDSSGVSFSAEELIIASLSPSKDSPVALNILKRPMEKMKSQDDELPVVVEEYESEDSTFFNSDDRTNFKQPSDNKEGNDVPVEAGLEKEEVELHQDFSQSLDEAYSSFEKDECLSPMREDSSHANEIVEEDIIEHSSAEDPIPEHITREEVEVPESISIKLEDARPAVENLGKILSPGMADDRTEARNLDDSSEMAVRTVDGDVENKPSSFGDHLSPINLSTDSGGVSKSAREAEVNVIKKVDILDVATQVESEHVNTHTASTSDPEELEAMKKQNKMLLDCLIGIYEATQTANTLISGIENEKSEEFSSSVKAIYGSLADKVECAYSELTQVDSKAHFARSYHSIELTQVQKEEEIRLQESEAVAALELLRIERAQYKFEYAEWEKEATELRIMRSEAESLASSLRSDLRKSRTQLACQVAAATSLKRENTSLLKEVEILRKEIQISKRDAEYFKGVSAKAQRSLEMLKSSPSICADIAGASKNIKNVGSQAELKDHCPVNATAELQSLKSNMAKHLDKQISQTKAALECTYLDSTVDEALVERHNQLSNLVDQLHDKEIASKTALNNSRNALSRVLGESVLKQNDEQKHLVLELWRKCFIKDQKQRNVIKPEQPEVWTEAQSVKMSPLSSSLKDWSEAMAGNKTRTRAFNRSQALLIAKQSMQEFQAAVAFK